MNHSSVYDADIKRGESFKVDFKREFPQQASDLSKSIASFASSSGGRIYIGVDNDGTVIGSDIKSVDDLIAFDKWQKRIEGTCGSVSPRIRVSVDFIKRQGKVIVVIDVPKGSEPIYFVNGIPYLRHLTSSRIASPEEVRDAHRIYFENQGLIQEIADEEQQFLVDAIYRLSDVILISRDFRDHVINPDLAQMLYDLREAGEDLIDLGSEELAHEFGVGDEQKSIGNSLVELSNYSFSMGSESLDQFGTELAKVTEEATRLEAEISNQIEIPDLSEISEFIDSNLRELQKQLENAERYYRTGEFERLWDSSRILAYNFNRLGHLPDPNQVSGLTKRLRELGEKLRGIASYQKYFYFGLGTNPLLRLESPISEVRSLARDIASLAQISAIEL